MEDRRSKVRSAGRSGLVLVVMLAAAQAHAGEPPSDQMVARTEKAASWLLGLRLADAQKQAFRQALIADWAARTPEQNARLSPQLDELEKLMAAEPASREITRVKVGGDYLEEMRKEPQRPLYRFLLPAWDAAHPALAAGTPRLTREVADAFAQLYTFMFVEATGGKHAPLERKLLDESAANLAARWPKMRPEQRERLAQTPLHLAAMRYRWRGYAEPSRANLRAGWRKQFEPAIAKISARRAAAEGARPAGGDQAAAMARFQKQMADNQATVSFVSDMLKMQADTSATIVRNMGPYEYEYKWVYKPD